MSKNIITLICISLLFCAGLSVNAQNDISSRRKDSFNSEDLKVKETLSNLIFGIQNKITGFCLSYYKPTHERGNDKASSENLFEEFEIFFETIHSCDGKPIVHMSNLETEWYGDKTLGCYHRLIPDFGTHLPTSSLF